jgi:hypothetical protein
MGLWGKSDDEKMKALDKRERQYPGFCQKPRNWLGQECLLKANHDGRCKYL